MRTAKDITFDPYLSLVTNNARMLMLHLCTWYAHQVCWTDHGRRDASQYYNSNITTSMSTLAARDICAIKFRQNVARVFSCRLRRLGSVGGNAPHAPRTSAPVCSTSRMKQGTTRHRQAEPPSLSLLLGMVSVRQ